MSAATTTRAHNLSPQLAAVLVVDAEPLRVPPLELWPAEGLCFIEGRRVEAQPTRVRSPRLARSRP